jgi:hypothetical protein
MANVIDAEHIGRGVVFRTISRSAERNLDGRPATPASPYLHKVETWQAQACRASGATQQAYPMIRHCPLRVVVKIAHSSGKTSRLAPLAKSGDNTRVRQDAAGPRSNSRVPDGEQIDGFKGLCGGPSENRSQLNSRATASGNQGLCVEKNGLGAPIVPRLSNRGRRR